MNYRRYALAMWVSDYLVERPLMALDHLPVWVAVPLSIPLLIVGFAFDAVKESAWLRNH